MLYLASQSPQRAQLLTAAGLDFTVVASSADEELIQHPHPQALAMERAEAKAAGAIEAAQAAGAQADGPADGQPSDIILAADTVVAVGREVLGKPRDDEDARRMLRLLSHQAHTVTTAQVGMTVAGLRAIRVSLTRVTMRPMSDEDITAYLATGEHRDRAGSYAIQESGDRFVIDLDGERDTVIGLNIQAVCNIIAELEAAGEHGNSCHE